jgi:hypothetical protein
MAMKNGLILIKAIIITGLVNIIIYSLPFEPPPVATIIREYNAESISEPELGYHISNMRFNFYITILFKINQ